MTKKIAMSGATGFIASNLIPVLEAKGFEIVPLLRKDFEDKNLLKAKLKECDGVINLAGEPIIKRWSKSYKKKLYSSRVNLTRMIVETFEELKSFPEFFISASAVGIYKDGTLCTENCDYLREDFLGVLCRDWENAALALKDKTRVCVLRIGVVLGKNGGIIKRISPVFKAGLGGKLGSGKQGFSWIHIEDLCRIVLFLMEKKDLSGIFNAVSMKPVSNMEFTKSLSSVLKRPAIFPVPAFMLKLIFAEGAVLLIEGQKALPERLLLSDFTFNYPEITPALKKVFYE